MTFLLAVVILVAYLHAGDALKLDKMQKKTWKLRKEEVVRFTSYHLYFQTVWKPARDVCLACEAANQTSGSIESAVDTWTARRHSLRTIDRSQISWKPPADLPKKSNSTQQAPDAGNKDKESSSSSRKQVVHDYLALSLTAPNHPYSDEMVRALSIAAPMFPQVYVLNGNAAEFSDIANKYTISSFPVVILFRNGMFSKEIFVRDPAELAGELSLWTKSLPRSYPIPLDLPKEGPPIVYLTLPKMFKWAQPLFDVFPFPAGNLEPFIGLTTSHQEWEAIAFVFSLIYVAFRIPTFVKWVFY